MDICDLIEQLENIRNSKGEDVEVVVQDRIKGERIDPYLKLTYSNKEFISYTSGNYFVNKILLL